MPDMVVKEFQTPTAQETIRSYVVQRLIELSAQAATLQTMLFMKKRNRMASCSFKAGILNFYQFLRPKMMQKAEYLDICGVLDYFLYNPTKFRLSDAFTTFTNLNQFCEDYKLTSTVVWTGQRTKEDVMV